MQRMPADDLGSAIVVAHQAVPVVVVALAREPGGLRVGANLGIHHREQLAGELTVAVVDRLVERILRPSHTGQRHGVDGAVVGAPGDVHIGNGTADRGIADVAHRCGRPRLILHERGHVCDPADDLLIGAKQNRRACRIADGVVDKTVGTEHNLVAATR